MVVRAQNSAFGTIRISSQIGKLDRSSSRPGGTRYYQERALSASASPTRATERFTSAPTSNRDRRTRCSIERSNGIEHRARRTEASRKHEDLALPTNDSTHQQLQMLIARNCDGLCPRYVLQQRRDEKSRRADANHNRLGLGAFLACLRPLSRSGSRRAFIRIVCRCLGDEIRTHRRRLRETPFQQHDPLVTPLHEVGQLAVTLVVCGILWVSPGKSSLRRSIRWTRVRRSIDKSEQSIRLVEACHQSIAPQGYASSRN